MHFQVWSVLALIALVFVISSTAKSAINPDDIDKVEVNDISHFEEAGHNIQKREDESEEPEEPEEEPTTIKPKKKKKKTKPAAADPGRITIINKIVNKGPKGGRQKNYDDYNEQPAPEPVAEPVAAQPAAQASGGGRFWSFLKNVAEVVHIGVLGG